MAATREEQEQRLAGMLETLEADLERKREAAQMDLRGALAGLFRIEGIDGVLYRSPRLCDLPDVTEALDALLGAAIRGDDRAHLICLLDLARMVLVERRGGKVRRMKPCRIAELFDADALAALLRDVLMRDGLLSEDAEQGGAGTGKTASSWGQTVAAIVDRYSMDFDQVARLRYCQMRLLAERLETLPFSGVLMMTKGKD